MRFSQVLDPGGFGSGLLIGLREGVEAALVVAIVLSYLAKTGRRQDFPAIWLGAAAAVGLAALLGVAIYVTLGDLRPPYEQLFEAGTMFVATAIVTWMLFWMRRQAAAMRGHLVAQIDRVVGDGGIFGLALLAFSSVIREGLEASIFVVSQARAEGTGGTSVVAGTLAGLLVAAFLGVGFYHGSRRINIRVFFRWTGIALIFVAAGLLGRAVHELIEINALTVATRPVFNLGGVLSDSAGPGSFLHAILGYSAAPEALVLAAYLAYLGAILWLYLRPTAAAPMPPSRAPGTGTAGAGS